jgi:hypothetical protein
MSAKKPVRRIPNLKKQAKEFDELLDAFKQRNARVLYGLIYLLASSSKNYSEAIEPLCQHFGIAYSEEVREQVNRYQHVFGL